MVISIKVKIYPVEEQQKILGDTMQEYIETVNRIVTMFIENDSVIRMTTMDVNASLPSTLKNQAINDARSIYKTYVKTKTRSVLKKPMSVWNNVNWRIKDNALCFPVWIGGKSQRILIPLYMNEYQQNQFARGKKGTLKIINKRGDWYAVIAVSIEDKMQKYHNTGVMGVDLGILCPAVAVTDKGKVKFFGDGRQNRYVRRKNDARRGDLKKNGRYDVLKKIGDKEQRWMKDQDHKISRGIIDFALEQNVGVIRLERLMGLRNAQINSKQRKANHRWAFYRLTSYIAYKAEMEGIKVEYVQPYYTSQKCPSCGKHNRTDNRTYQCECGFESHRDIVGALNIISAPLADGKSLKA